MDAPIRRSRSAARRSHSSWRNSRRPRAAITRFSPRKGTASAMVAIAAIADAVPLRGENRVIAALGLRELRQLECDRRAAERLLRIGASMLIRIQHGER